MKKILLWLVIFITATALLLIFGADRISYARAEVEQYPISFQQEVWLKTLAFCESRGKSDIKIMDSNDKYSYGAFMFQFDTFKSQGIKYEFFDKDVTDKELLEKIYDPNLQESIAHRMLLDGGKKNWYTCTLKLGTYPKN